MSAKKPRPTLEQVRALEDELERARALMARMAEQVSGRFVLAEIDSRAAEQVRVIVLVGGDDKEETAAKSISDYLMKILNGRGMKTGPFEAEAPPAEPKP